MSDRVIIPTSLWQHVIQKIHWELKDPYIELGKPVQYWEGTKTHELPDRSWSKFGTDLLTFMERTMSLPYLWNIPRAMVKLKVLKTCMSLLRRPSWQWLTPYLALLDHCHVRTEQTYSSRTQRFFGCRTCTLIPVSPKLPRPELQTNVKTMQVSNIHSPASQLLQYDSSILTRYLTACMK